MYAYYKNKKIYCGSVNLKDGVIEEVHTFKEAKNSDFHHTIYFSDAQIEKMKSEECGFFWVENGVIYSEWRNCLTENIIESIKKQIVIK